MTVRYQVLYPDDVPDAEIVIPKPKKRKFKIRPEDQLQIKCVKLLRERKIPFIVAQPERLNAPPQRRDWLKKLGILGNSGHAELILFMPNQVIAVELKSDDGKLSEAQHKWSAAMSLSGHRYVVIDSLGEFKLFLDSF